MSVVVASAGIAAIVFPAPLDPTPAVVVAAPIQVGGIVTALLGVTGLITSIGLYFKCKEDQVETLSKEAAQDRKNTELQEQVKKLQQQVDDIKNRKQDLQNSVDQIRKFVN